MNTGALFSVKLSGVRITNASFILRFVFFCFFDNLELVLAAGGGFGVYGPVAVESYLYLVSFIHPSSCTLH